MYIVLDKLIIVGNPEEESFQDTFEQWSWSFRSVVSRFQALGVARKTPSRQTLGFGITGEVLK